MVYHREHDQKTIMYKYTSQSHLKEAHLRSELAFNQKQKHDRQLISHIQYPYISHNSLHKGSGTLDKEMFLEESKPSTLICTNTIRNSQLVLLQPHKMEFNSNAHDLYFVY